MEMYQVIHGPALIPTGTLVQLSDAQAAIRKHQLRPLEAGWFLTLADVSFETGEVLTFCKPLHPDLLPAFLPPEMQQPIVGHPNHRKATKRTVAC